MRQVARGTLDSRTEPLAPTGRLAIAALSQTGSRSDARMIARGLREGWLGLFQINEADRADLLRAARTALKTAEASGSVRNIRAASSLLLALADANLALAKAADGLPEADAPSAEPPTVGVVIRFDSEG